MNSEHLSAILYTITKPGAPGCTHTIERRIFMLDSIQGSSSLAGLGRLGNFPKPEPLTDDQKSQVQSILSEYDSDNLTADDAKAIFKAFRKAGINGAGLKEAIEATGFDAEKLRSLAGADGPQGPGGPGGPGGPPPGGMGMNRSGSSTTGVSMSTLKSLQSILSQYDFSSISTDQQSELFTKLSSSGLLKNGNIIDLNA
jgi:hypothetical protein